MSWKQAALSACTALLMLPGCAEPTARIQGSSAPAAVSAPAEQISPEEGAALLERTLGSRDAESGCPCYYVYRSAMEQAGKAYYQYDFGWLSDGSHAAYITSYLVDPASGAVQEYLPPAVASARAELEGAADALLDSMKAADFAAVARWADAEGVTFTPFSTVDFTRDPTLSAAELAELGTGPLRTWGRYDGSGEPIRLSGRDYWDRFVWNTDYTAAPAVSMNRFTRQGNSWENVGTAYPRSPEAREGQYAYMDYCFPAQDPRFGGADWCALKLVFVRRSQAWKLAGVIHSEATP